MAYQGVQLPNPLANALSGQKLQAMQMENQAARQQIDMQNSPEFKQKADELARIDQAIKISDATAKIMGSVKDDNSYQMAKPMLQQLHPEQQLPERWEPDRAAQAKMQHDQTMQQLALRRAQLDNELLGTKINRNRQMAQANVDPNTGMPIPKQEKAPTQDQTNAATFAARASTSDQILNQLGSEYSPMGVSAQQTLGVGANWALSENTQKASQAQRDFINAVLRKESGATISPQEFENAKQQYFPQPGESDAVIKQKAQNRAISIQGLQNAAGRAAFSPNVNPDVMGTQTPQSGAQPTGKVIRYANLARRADEKFGGNIDAARQAAQAQGYQVIP